MMERHPGFAALVALLASTSACAQTVVVGVDPGDGSTSGNYTSQITGPRPGMVAVQAPGGVTYYIDSTEVSQAAYDLFLHDNPEMDPSSPTCGWKTTHLPGSEPSDANQLEGDPAECHPFNTLYDPTTHGDDPVVCVDWCDAAAYCAWVGKRLCGRIGGGPSSETDFANAATDAWFNACSNGGTTAFPYGDAYESGTCADGDTPAPVGMTAGCHGTTAPFDGIFDLSGNVAEWEDSCGQNLFNPNGGPAADRCTIRGGSVATLDPTVSFLFLSCAGQNNGDPRNMARPRTGVRCCAD
jgi:formylglycine-generating enzyme required for sulfatase activity